MIENLIRLKLGQFVDPYLVKSLAAMNAIKRIEVLEQVVNIVVQLPYPHASLQTTYLELWHALLQPHITGLKIHIELESRIDAHNGSQKVKGLAQIKNIIAVASGKGGVGKSTIAVNLALALANEGAQVGLLDADIYGPSQPTMLGVANQKPEVVDGRLNPILAHGIQSISIGYLIEQATPMIWRGPMLGKALQQLIDETNWQSLDYLVVDLPPGTGDVQLTLCQKLPVSGVLMVSTPQDVALLDVSRACAMFRKLNVPMLGVVENMSQYTCSHCGHEEALFGQSQLAQLAHHYELNIMAKFPLSPTIQAQTDAGMPPGGKGDKQFVELAHRVAAKLALQPKDYSAKFPEVVVQA